MRTSASGTLAEKSLWNGCGRSFWALIDAGAHNIDLVNPTHYAHVVAEALSQPLPVPVVWNSGGYDRVETLRALEGTVDIYLPDYKYPDARDAQCWAGAADYPQVARAAIQEMVRQTGPYVLDQEGILQRGVVIRHLLLPGRAEPGQGSDGLGAGDLPAPHRALFPDESVHPLGPGGGISPLDRRLRKREARAAMAYLENLSLDGFFQGEEAARAEYIPAFDLTGV